MPVTIQCPSCGKKLKAGDALSGKKTQCPGCKTAFKVPDFLAAAGKTPAAAASAPSSPASPSSSAAVPPLAPSTPAPTAGGLGDFLPPPAPAPAAPPSSDAKASKPDDGTFALNFGDDPPPLGGGSGGVLGGGQGDGGLSLDSLMSLEAAAPPSDALAAAPDPAALAPAPAAAPAGPAGPGQGGPVGPLTKREKRREEGHKYGPKTYGTIFGRDITNWTFVKAAVVLAGIIYAGYLYYRNPVRLVEVQSVHAGAAVNSITRLKGATILNPLAGGTPGEFAVGGSGRLFVTRPDAQGDYLIVRLYATQQYFGDREQFAARYAVQVRGGHVTLSREGNTEEGWILERPLSNNHRFGLAEGKTDSEVAIYPPDVKPTSQKTQPSPTGGRPLGGELYFHRDTGVEGELTYRRLGAMSPLGGSTGLTARGKLTYYGPGEIVVGLSYDEDYMNIDVPDGDTAWHGAKALVSEDDISPFTKVYVTALIKKPAGQGKMELKLGGEHVAYIVDSFMGQDAAKFVHAEQYDAPSREDPGDNLMSDAFSKKGKKRLSGGYVDTLLGSKKMAEGSASMSQMKNIVTTILLFQQQNQRYPADFEELIGFEGAVEGYLVNPRTRQKRGYIYEPPPPGAVGARTAILWEKVNGEKAPGGAVGYSDGTVK